MGNEMKALFRCRPLVLVMYLMYLVAGLVFIALPSTDALREDTNWIGQVIWHLFLVGGAITSLVGVWKQNTMVEAIGVPLLVTALSAYAAVLIANDDMLMGARLGLGALILAGSMGLLERLAVFIQRLRIEADLDRRGL